MKIIIVGLGSIGQRHVKLLKAHYPSYELCAFRHTQGKPNDLGIPEVYTWQEVDRQKPDVAFICGPTHQHIAVALECARRGMHLFIEKPLSDRLEGLDELQVLIHQHKLTCYVAYCLRFHPVIKRLHELLEGQPILSARVVCSSLLHRWRPEQSTPNYSMFRSQGGGVILDLSHEFDYIQYLFGPIQRIEGRYGKRSNVTVDSEDYCDALVWGSHDVPVNVHLNFFSHYQERRVVIDLAQGSIVADILNGQIVIDNAQGHQVMDIPVNRDQWMHAQTDYFFQHLNNTSSLMNNLNEARMLLTQLIEFRS